MKHGSSTRKRIHLLSALLLAFLLVFNFSTYILYKRAKAYLDNELGERLQTIAVLLANSVELAEPDSLSMDSVDSSLYSLLYLAKTENLLSNILVLTPEGTTVVDLAHLSEPGEYNPFIDLDYSAVTLARSGFPASTPLYKSGDIYMKSAYAPLKNTMDQVTGIVGVEAGASFFQVLDSLRGAIILVDAASVLVILLLGFLFYRQSFSLDRAQETILQRENLATMGRMVAGIAHEIRNPLSIIKTSAERIRKQYGVEDEMFAYITEEVDELNRILTGYLNFARSEPQETGLYPLQKIVLRSLLLIESDASGAGITITHDLPVRDLMIECDDKRMQQALLNLLLNAVQAVETGGRIDISLRSTDGRAILSIADNGHGIEEKQMKEIFKPFYTTKKHGSGLGLSIVSNIVEAHNGTVSISSVPGKGTTVTITLPYHHSGDTADSIVKGK